MSISFKWSASTDNVAVSHYEVFRVGSLGVYATVAASPAPQYTDQNTPATSGGGSGEFPGTAKWPSTTSLFPSESSGGTITSYCYYIVAVDTSGNHSIPSGTACFSLSGTDTTPPTAPAGLSGSVSGEGTPGIFTLGDPVNGQLGNVVLG